MGKKDEGLQDAQQSVETKIRYLRETARTLTNIQQLGVCVCHICMYVCVYYVSVYVCLHVCACVFLCILQKESNVCR